MPALYLMSWEPSRARWWKQYKGRRYVVSPRQLNAPPTKEGSYRAANLWWEEKRAELDGQPQAPSLDELISGRIEQHRALIYLQDQVSTGPESSMRSLVLGDIDQLLNPDPAPAPIVPPDRTVKSLIARYLDSQSARSKAGEITQAEVSGRGYSLQHFERFLGPESSIDVLSPERWQSWYEHLLSLDRSRSYKSKLLSHSRWFCRYLDDLAIHPAPKNLDKQSIKNVPVSIQVFSVDQVKDLWSRANPTVRLFIGLSLNCGFTQKDISDLSHDEVDWEKGIITRKRSKSKDEPNAPTVSYPLWPEVFRLLSFQRSADPIHVLGTRSGRPWVDRQSKNTDNIRIAFAKLDPSLSFKYLRKSSSSLLSSHPEFGRFAQYFLGHAPSTVADTHYVKPSQDRFEAALLWLRSRYFES